MHGFCTLLMLTWAILGLRDSSAQQGASACCSSDADCVALANSLQMSYLANYEKALVCDLDCPGLVNCDMFGICATCRGCFMTCEGAAKYIDETAAPEESIYFCPNGEVDSVSECYASSASSASGFGSGTGSMSSGASGGGSAFGSASGRDVSASGSGFGSLGLSTSGTGSGGSSISSGDSMNSSTASASASGAGSLTHDGTGSGSASASGDRGEGDVPGCTCEDVELNPAEAEFFCSNGKSMYCDAECLPNSDHVDRLFDDMGGLWCKPFGWEGCRLCRLECSINVDEYCVPCPAGVQDWCV